MVPAASGAGTAASSAAAPVARSAAGPGDQPYPDASPSVAAQAGSALVVRGAPAPSATLVDTSTAAVLWEGGLPFGTPVVYPDVAALGDGTYLVAGVPCASVEAMDDSGPDCSPGGVSLATFDPGRRRFDVLAAGGLAGRTPYLDVLGRTGAGVVVRADEAIYRLPAGGGDLVPYAAAPLDGLSLACLDGDTVTVVEHRLTPGDASPAPGRSSEAPAAPFVPLVGASLGLRSGRWTGLGGPAATYRAEDTFALACAGGDVLAAPGERPLSSASPYVSHRLDGDARAWADVPPPPQAFAGSVAAPSDGPRVALSVSSSGGDGAMVLLFDGESETWSVHPGGEGAQAGAVALTGDRLVSIAEGARPMVVDLAAGARPASLPVPARAVAPPVPGLRPAAAGVDLPVHEWNMCGNICNAGSTAPADVVVANVTAARPRPWSVALTEVCLNSNQYARTVDALDDLGYHADVYVARASVAGCGGTPFGNVVLAAGVRLASSTYAFPTQDGSAEVRGVVCSRSGSAAGGWLACATHLDNSAVALGQEDDLFDHLALAGDTLRVVGGDYNLTPEIADLAKWRAAYDELDETAPYLPTIGDGRKIDYIWVRDLGDTRPRSVSSVPFPAVSDHRYYSGRFRLTL